MAKKSKKNKIIEILQHNISYYYKNYDGEMPESDQDHVKDAIVDGCNQGELCFHNSDFDKEYRGWWHIER